MRLDVTDQSSLYRYQLVMSPSTVPPAGYRRRLPPTVSPDDDTPLLPVPSAPASDVRLVVRPAVGRCQPLPIRPADQPHVRVEERAVGVDLVLRVVHVQGVDGTAGEESSAHPSQ